MKMISTVAELRHTIRQWRQQNQTIAFVPTMGNLHEGHITLIQQARQHADRVVASIFVNPLQFGAGEDFGAYPRTEAEDSQKLSNAGCDVLFLPSMEEMYPQPQQTLVSVAGVSERHCGQSRPGHFVGVATVVCKLFNMVQPDCALFGEKDFQQLAVIRQMVMQLNLPIEIIGVPTVRETDGLAMSSRNGYLTPEQRALAPALYQTLCELQAKIAAGYHDYQALTAQATEQLNGMGFSVDYLNICNAQTLQFATVDDQSLVILVAAKLGKARLIDNVTLILFSNRF